MAIGLVLGACIPWLAWIGALDTRAAIGAGGGLFVALTIGLLDDMRVVLRPHLKLLAHFLAALWVLGWMAGPPALELEGFRLEPPWLRAVVAGVYVMWVVNLTNFEDGIDALLGAQALTVSLGTVIIWRLSDPVSTGWFIPAVLAATALGFLVWNLPPARVFAGDAGSYSVGMWFAVMSLQAAQVRADLFWAWLILMGVFVSDATLTLLRRLLRGERIFEGHREHAYQRLARRWGSHGRVVLAVAAVNVACLWPLAVAVATNRIHGLFGVMIAYVPLSVAALWIGGPSEPDIHPAG